VQFVWGEPLLVLRAPEPQEKAARDIELRDAIERIVLEFPGYGYRRTTKELYRRGWTVNHKRVLRLMRQESLLCQIKRRFRSTTDSSHSLKRCPNLIEELELDGPDLVWLSDITYVRLPQSFCYLASIIDDFSRYCVGWALSKFIDTRLTLSALQMALELRSPAAGLIHHSDQGVQYASSEYVERLEQASPGAYPPGFQRLLVH
jgi:putative transposase